MKKAVSFLAAILLLIPMTAFCLEQNDVEKMSVEELVELRQWVEEALVNKGDTTGWTIIQPGFYEVGRDLPAGVYEIKRGAAKISLAGHIYCYYTKEDYDAYKAGESSDVTMKESVDVSSVFKDIAYRISLDEGNYLDFRSGTVYLMRKVDSILFD